MIGYFKGISVNYLAFICVLHFYQNFHCYYSLKRFYYANLGVVDEIYLLTQTYHMFQGREMDTRCTIYKKTEEVYQLKLKASRMFYSEVCESTKIG